MGKINKFANLYRRNSSGELEPIDFAPIKSKVRQDPPRSRKYPGL